MPVELLPDIVTDLLLRLPAKSLLRFRCLSNSIRGDIDSSDFAQIHLKRSIETRSHRKLIFTNRKDFYASDFDDELSNALRLTDQFPDPEQYCTEIIGTCLGLVLLYFLEIGSPAPKPELFLWNPTTRKFKILPPTPCSNSSQLDPLNSYSQLGLCCGLGYDSASDDFKVVRIISAVKSISTYQVWVFSLRSNSWRKAQDLHLNLLLSSYPLGFVNGFLYWSYIEHGSRKVACFDLANEVFFTLPSFCSPQDGGLVDKLTGDGDDDEFVSVHAVILEGNVLMHKDYVEEPQVDEFYSCVVDEVSALPGGNWNKAFTFVPPEHHSIYSTLLPLAYSKDGASILLQRHKEMFWYDMEKKTSCRVKLLEEMSESGSFYFHVIAENLISLG